MNRRRNSADLCYTIHTQEITMDAAENPIVVYQPNETVRALTRVDGPKADTFESVCADALRKSKMLYYTRHGTA